MKTKYASKFATGFPGGMTSEIEAGYRNDMRENAKEGWRFVQAFAPSVGKAGVSWYADLIFEREIVEEE